LVASHIHNKQAYQTINEIVFEFASGVCHECDIEGIKD
jgi:hypothetical protein